jgi:hypothetical protein
MSENNFRIILGAWLVAALMINSVHLMYALVGLLLFEGITNLRVPTVMARLRSGDSALEECGVASAHSNARICFEAERGLRLIVATLIILPMTSLGSFLWLLPWFVGFALIGAGLSGICPMVLALRWLGLR